MSAAVPGERTTVAPGPTLVDTHAHLAAEAFEPDRPAVLTRARSAGVGAVVVIGDTLGSSAQAAVLAETEASLYATAGIHPHAAAAAGELEYQKVWELAQHPRVMAIGEIGLDYHYDFASPGDQKAVLSAQLRIARELGLPAVIHNREADPDLKEILDREAAWEFGCLLHCFWSDAEMARWAAERGFFFGVGGPITFKSNGALRDVVRSLPPEKLVLETDSPYLAPVPHRGRRNEPAFVAAVADKLAALLGCAAGDLAALTTANACRFFGIRVPAEDEPAGNGWRAAKG